MSITTCAISGLPLQQPVLSRKTGHVFERDLILKQIKATGQCPITGQNLEEDDLINISGKLAFIKTVEKAAAPRSITTTTVPGLLSVMQSEWDSLLLESFKLRSDLDATRQELSHALHQYDAACRVICRLIKERDEARRDLAAQGQVRSMPQEFQKIQGPPEEQKSIPSKDPRQKFVANLEKMHSVLSERRATKEIPPNNPVPESRYTKPSGKTTTIDLKQPLTSVDIDPLSQRVIAAGQRGCYLYDVNTLDQLYSLNHHKDAISEVVFSPASGSHKQIILAASRDGTGSLVNYSDSSYQVPILLNKDNSPLTSCRFSTLADYAIFGAEDGITTLQNICTSQTVMKLQDKSVKGGVSSLAFHPDGVLLATGQSTGLVSLWDLRSNSKIGALSTPGLVKSLDFSNKGIYLASASQGSQVIEIWDARHFGNQGVKSKPVKLTHISQPSSVRYDISGKVLGACGADGIEFYKSKGWKSLGVLDQPDVTGFQQVVV